MAIGASCPAPDGDINPLTSGSGSCPSINLQSSLMTLNISTIIYTILAIFITGISMSFFKRKNHLPLEGRNVIVTGGSQGMGKSVAKLVASRGANVAIIARDPKKLELAGAEIADVISQNGSKYPDQKFTIVSADLAKPEEAKRAVAEAESVLGITDILWCCAGGSTPGIFKDQSTSELQYMMDVNYFASAYTAHAVLNSMVANPLPPAKRNVFRKIIFTSSIAHFSPIVGYSTYTPAKSALRSLTDCLRQECILYDIDVACSFPGEIDTPGLAAENRTKPQLTKDIEAGSGSAQSAEEVASVVLKGLERGETLVASHFIGKVARAGMWGPTPKLWGDILWETILSFVVSIAWIFVVADQDSYVKKERKLKGLPNVDKK